MLTHYIVVRRDIPITAALAQVTHAAGESFYKLAMFPSSSISEQQTFSLQVGGVSPSSGANFRPDRTIAVVFGARNEAKLLKLERELLDANVPHIAVREPSAPWNGALMAIGLVPSLREAVAHYVRDFHMFPEPAGAQTPA